MEKSMKCFNITMTTVRFDFALRNRNCFCSVLDSLFLFCLLGLLEDPRSYDAVAAAADEAVDTSPVELRLGLTFPDLFSGILRVAADETVDVSIAEFLRSLTISRM